MPASRPATRSARPADARRAVHARRAGHAARPVLAAIILLAAGLRLTRLGLIEFEYDEATTVRTAMAIAREGHLPAVGMVSSEGPRNPTLWATSSPLPFSSPTTPAWRPVGSLSSASPAWG